MRLPRTIGCRFVPLLLVAVACGGSPEAPDSPPDRPAGELLRGFLVLGHEARSFTPCGEEEAAWVVDATPDRELTQAYESLTHQPYQPVFVEIFAAAGPAPDEGFGADYPDQVTIHELRRAVLEGPGCNEETSTFLFRVFGNEPSFSVVIDRDELRLSRMSHSGVAVFPSNGPEDLFGTLTFRSFVAMPHSEIHIELFEERCIDSMSGAWYGYRAKAEIDHQEFSGCAYAGSSPPEGAIRWERGQVQQVQRGCNGDACTWFRFDWTRPVSGLSEIATRGIRARIVDWIERPLADGEQPVPPQELIRRWEAEYARFKEQFPDSAQGHMVVRRVTVIPSAPAVVSLKKAETTYLGGAHPNRRVVYESLSSRGGRLLVPAEVIEPGKFPTLVGLAEIEFRRDRGIAPETSLAEAGFTFEDERFSLPRNFAVTSSGLVFHYDAYEIAPYATGPTTLNLDSPEVRNLLRPDYRLP